jgi:hypothetical protein
MLLNVITVGQRETVKIYQMITLTEQALRLVDSKKTKEILETSEILIAITK